MQKIIIVAFVGIVLDVLTGFIKAWFNKQVDSSIIREGGKNKIREIIIIIFQFTLGEEKNTWGGGGRVTR